MPPTTSAVASSPSPAGPTMPGRVWASIHVVRSQGRADRRPWWHL